MMRSLVVLVAIVALAGGAARADAAGCVKKKGKLFSRAACRKSERPLDTTTLAPAGPTGSDGERGEAGKFPLQIVDAADREVGPVLTFGFGTALVRVSNPLLPSPMPFAVQPTGFGNIGDDAFAGVYYTEAGCAGQPYIAEGLGSYVHVEGAAAYLIAGGPTSITVASLESGEFAMCAAPNLTDRGTCCEPQAFAADGVPATRIAIADLGFTSPFRAVPR